MLVKNWMSKNPVTISSEVSARQAQEIFEENRVPFIPVVDDGSFRGFIARRDLREAASWAISTQDIHEIEYYNNRLKVRDIMVRKPLSLSMNDTVETAIQKGRQFGRTFLAVLDGDRLVGTLSNRDLTAALNQVLGAEEHLHGISIELNGQTRATIKGILKDILDMDLEIKGLFTLSDPESEKKRLMIRFEAKCLDKITKVIEKKGYHILEVDKKRKNLD